jgi:hypothetical protein
MDLTGEIGVGESVRIGQVDVTVDNVLPPKYGADGTTVERPGQLITNRPWPGVSASGVRVARLGKSAEQQQLEALAAEKLKCTTIYCLAKIEERERALPFSFPRLLVRAYVCAFVRLCASPLDADAVFPMRECFCCASHHRELPGLPPRCSSVAATSSW